MIKVKMIFYFVTTSSTAITLVVNYKCKGSQKICTNMTFYVYLKLFSNAVIEPFLVNSYLFELII